MKVRTCAAALALVMAMTTAATAVPAPAPQDHELPVTLVMNAQSIGNSISGQTRMTVTINRWSDESERDRVLGALIELGPGAVRNELQQLPEAGRVRVGTQNSYPIQYARLTETEDGGYRIVLATDRDIDAFEAYYRTRTLDYDVALAELRVGADMTGDGVLAAGVTLDWHEDTNTVVIENYDQQPVRLHNVRIHE